MQEHQRVGNGGRLNTGSVLEPCASSRPSAAACPKACAHGYAPRILGIRCAPLFLRSASRSRSATPVCSSGRPLCMATNNNDNSTSFERKRAERPRGSNYACGPKTGSQKLHIVRSPRVPREVLISVLISRARSVANKAHRDLAPQIDAMQLLGRRCATRGPSPADELSRCAAEIVGG